MVGGTSSGSFDYGITPFGRAAFAQDDRVRGDGFLWGVGVIHWVEDGFKAAMIQTSLIHCQNTRSLLPTRALMTARARITVVGMTICGEGD